MCYIKYHNIEAERARLSLTKEALAKKLEASNKSYYNWVSGRNPIPSNVLLKMSTLFNVSIDYLLNVTIQKTA